MGGGGGGGREKEDSHHLLYLRVCLRAELHSPVLQLMPQLRSIVDGAIVNQSDAVVEVHVRVRVLVRSAAFKRNKERFERVQKERFIFEIRVETEV